MTSGSGFQCNINRLAKRPVFFPCIDGASRFQAAGIKPKTFHLIITPLSDTLVLVELKKFTTKISNQLKERLKELSDQGYAEIILDLRNNSGGVFIESVRAAEVFLPEKSILGKTCAGILMP